MSPHYRKQHNNSSYALGTVAGYAYNGSGERELAVQYAPGSNNQQQMQSWREYTYFNGQPYAEKDNTGAWTDYIYAGAKKIAKVGGSDTRLHREATVCGGCGWQWTALYTGTALHGVTVQAGDRLVVSQFATPGTTAGVGLNFTDGSYGPSLGMVDAQGYQSDSDGVTGSWHHRVIDLSSLAGRVIDYAYFMTPGTNGAGHWSVDYRNFAYVAADGTVTKLYSGEDPSGWFQPATTGQSGLTTVSQTGAPYPGVAAPLYYYLADHLGTTQMELSAGGWPVWQGQFAPFGQEIDNQNTSMRFKFTGKERDTESGLDYFGARYYASNMGRFMSPDWAGKPQAVPYSLLSNPQTLNLYTYVDNNPISQADADGHDGHMSIVDYAAYTGAVTTWQNLSFMASLAAGSRNSATSYGGFSDPPTAQQTNAADNNYTFTLNGKPMSNIVGPDGVATPAFSGLGGSKDDPSKTGNADSGPLPTGSYYIVDRPSGGLLGAIKDFFRPEKGTWFALYRNDGKIDDSTTVNGTVRGSFRLHPKGPLGISEGCITVNSKADYIRLSFQLMSAKRANIPGTSIRYYGTMEVK